MKWNKAIQSWNDGEYPKFNKDYPFIWRTNSYNDESIYKEEIIKAVDLPSTGDYSLFEMYFKDEKYAVDFQNITRDTVLIVPVSKQNKCFANIQKFDKQASASQKKAFWKKVAVVAEREKIKHGAVWISTHGYGVPWLHVRVSSTPKYYGDSKLLIN